MFHRDGRINPVEYKRGKPKLDDCDRVQLCAQALCLEEMFDTDIPHGFLLYEKRHRRTEVVLDAEFPDDTRTTAARLHALIDSRQTPAAQWSKKCDACSLERICLPNAMRLKSGVARWLDRQLAICDDI